MINEQFLESLSKKARDVCLKTNNGRQKHVSFIIKNRRILSCGVNHMRKTHPDSPSPYKTIHAEFDAILKLRTSMEKIREQKLTVVNFRLLKTGKFGLSMPCKFCRHLLTILDFSCIYYSVDEYCNRVIFGNITL